MRDIDNLGGLSANNMAGDGDGMEPDGGERQWDAQGQDQAWVNLVEKRYEQPNAEDRKSLALQYLHNRERLVFSRLDATT